MFGRPLCIIILDTILFTLQKFFPTFCFAFLPKYHFHITVSTLKIQDVLHNIVNKFLYKCSHIHSGTVCCTYSALYGFNQCIVVIEYVYN